MTVYYRCKACGVDHVSPIGYGSEEAFDRANLSGNDFPCPTTRTTAMYDKADLYWMDRDLSRNGEPAARALPATEAVSRIEVVEDRRKRTAAIPFVTA